MHPRAPGEQVVHAADRLRISHLNRATPSSAFPNQAFRFNTVHFLPTKLSVFVFSTLCPQAALSKWEWGNLIKRVEKLVLFIFAAGILDVYLVNL